MLSIFGLIGQYISGICLLVGNSWRECEGLLMVCCHSSGNTYGDLHLPDDARGTGLITHICLLISTWMGRVREIFRRPSTKEGAQTTLPRSFSPGHGKGNGNVGRHHHLGISTPHHVPMAVVDLSPVIRVPPVAAAARKSRWTHLFSSVAKGRERNDEVELQSIEQQSDEKPPSVEPPVAASMPAAVDAAPPTTMVKKPPMKPAELWRNDEMQMLQGSYKFDPQFAARYRLKQLLGEGSFGFVWVAERVRDHREVAVKFILRDKVPVGSWIFDGELGLVPLEVHLMRAVVHPNIIQFLDYFADFRFVYLVSECHGTSWTWPNPALSPQHNPGLRPAGQLLALAAANSKEATGISGMATANGEDHVHASASPHSSLVLTRRPPCDLFECIEAHGRMPEETIRKIFGQLVDAVIYLYGQGIVHRDLKDENIVVDEHYNIKLIDFGSAGYVPRLKPPSVDGHQRPDCRDEGYFDKFNGTIAFAAPEILRGLRYRPSEAEVWSLGVLLYTMAFKKSPFNSSDAILHSAPSLPPPSEMGEGKPGIYDLLRKMLQKNPLLRVRLTDIPTHPWLQR